MRVGKIIIFLLLISLIFTGCSAPIDEEKVTDRQNEDINIAEEATDEQAENMPVQEDILEGVFPGQMAPDFTLPLLIGDKEITLSEFRGKPVLLVFWVYWWPSCRVELTELRKVYEEIDRESFEIIAINITSQDNIEDAKKFFVDNNLPYVSLSDNLGAVSSSFKVRSVPTNVLINANGIVYLNQPGKISDENLRKALEDLWGKDS